MPRGKKIRHYLFLIGAFGIFLFSLPSTATPAEKPLRNYGTYYSTIYYSSEEDILRFVAGILPPGQSPRRDPEKAIRDMGDNVDRIVFRVKTLLDMYPINFHFIVRVYGAEHGVEEAYRDHGMTGKPPIAFYSPRTNSIYLSTDKLSPGIFAHEVAHAVINAYFDPPPPSKMQEILSQYVDRHLWDESPPPK